MESLDANQLIFHIQPDEGIELLAVTSNAPRRAPGSNVMKSPAELPEHLHRGHNNSTGDPSANGFQKRIDEGRREIRHVPDPIVDEINSEPD